MGDKPDFSKSAYEEKFIELMSMFRIEYGELASKVKDRVIYHMGTGKGVVKSVNLSLNEIHFSLNLRGIIQKCLLTAAAYGYGIAADVGVQLTKVKHALMYDKWTSDNMNLSTRLHGNDAKMRQSIVSTIQSGMNGVGSFTDISNKLAEGYGSSTIINKAELPKYLSDLESIARKVAGGDKELLKPLQSAISEARKQVDKLSQNHAPTVAMKTAYKALIDACEKFESDAIDRTVEMAMNERTRYYAERITRTEMTRAYADGVFAKTLDDDEVIGYRWRLSSNHPRFDICDIYAHVDFYNMGAGIYPKSAFPSIPAHPHCRCSPAPVYSGTLDEDVSESDFSDDDLNDYLDDLDPSDRKELFNAGDYDKYKETNSRNLIRNFEEFKPPASRFTKEMFES